MGVVTRATISRLYKSSEVSRRRLRMATGTRRGEYLTGFTSSCSMWYSPGSLPNPSPKTRGNFLTNWSADKAGLAADKKARLVHHTRTRHHQRSGHDSTGHCPSTWWFWSFQAKCRPDSFAFHQIAVKKKSEISTPNSQTNSSKNRNRCPTIRNNCRAYWGHVK